MAQSLISIITLATLVAASPMGKRQTESCSETWWSQAGDTCDSIGAIFGLTGDAIKQYNEYVDCTDIWVNTPICIGPLPSVTTIFPSYAQPTSSTTSSCVETWWSQPGDTCDSIGALFGLTGTDIFNVNTYLDCSNIWTNTPVCIPTLPSVTTIFPVGPSDTIPSASVSCVETWWSQAGDTCQSIGAIFGLTEQIIIDANSYVNCSDIWVNTPICIPYLPSVTTIFPSYVSSAPVVIATSSVSCVETWWSQAGDTCQSIGAIFGLTEQTIIDANSYVNCSDIWVNTPICIPYLPSVTTIFPSYVSNTLPVPVSTSGPVSCASTYTSVAGDNCDSIGAQYGLTGTQIWDANQFLNCTDIWAWTPVCIPYPVPTEFVSVVPVPTSTIIISDPVPTD